MADAKRCDGCGEYGDGVNWLKLERLVVYLLQAPDVRHFHDYKCLAAFTNRLLGGSK